MKTLEDYVEFGKRNTRKVCYKIGDIFPGPIAKILILVMLSIFVITGTLALILLPIEFAIRWLIKFLNKE